MRYLVRGRGKVRGRVSTLRCLVRVRVSVRGRVSARVSAREWVGFLNEVAAGSALGVGVGWGWSTCRLGSREYRVPIYICIFDLLYIFISYRLGSRNCSEVVTTLSPG